MDANEQPRDQDSAKPRGRKAVHWKRDPIILARLPRVEAAHLAGKSNVAIAAEMGLAEVTIREDLKRLNSIWKERVAGDQEQLRAAKVRQLEDIHRRAVAAAEFDERAERAVLYGHDEDGARVSVERDAKGAAQFRGQKAQALNVARQAVMDQAKVLGLIVEKQEVAHDPTAPLTIRIERVETRIEPGNEGG